MTRKIKNSNITPGALTSASLNDTGVTSGNYGSASQVPVLTVNAKGQITTISTTSVAGVSAFTYTSGTKTLNIATADGGSFDAALTNLATETYVNTAVANLIDSAPSTLDTLNELAAALGDDSNFATTVTTALGTKANLSGATFTGEITATTGTFTSLRNSGISNLGTNTYSKGTGGVGDIFLDNGTNDSPGLLFYYGNNKNWGIDTYVANGSQALRIVSDLNETGGTVRASFNELGTIFNGYVDTPALNSGSNKVVDSNGNITFDGTPTATNQNRGVFWTAYDKEAVGDTSDAAYIRHTTNVGGLAGSVLEISSLNDSNDGINLVTPTNNGARINGNIIWNTGNVGYSQSGNGYVSLPNGLIMQWCVGAGVSSESDTTTSFPTAFPNACLFVTVGTQAPSGDRDSMFQMRSYDRNGVTSRLNQFNSAGGTCYPTVWAIGY